LKLIIMIIIKTDCSMGRKQKMNLSTSLFESSTKSTSYNGSVEHEDESNTCYFN